MNNVGIPDPHASSQQPPEARSRHLLHSGRFTTLATTDGRRPWASTVNYVPLYDPLRLMWYSMRTARHSRNIANHSKVSGSIYLTGLPGFGLDGAQYVGTAREIAADELTEAHHQYYQLNFPNEDTRRDWMLPKAEFAADGPRSFYVVHIERWWLLDIDQWLIDKRDQRIEVARF